MSTRVRARRLTQDEGQYLQRLVRRGRHDSVRYRRALIIMASASGTGAPAIAQLVAADPDTVRDVIHAFNAQGLAMLAPHWGAGRPRRITDEDIAVVVATAMTRPKKLGLPFTHWSIRKLTAYLGGWYGHHDPTLVPARMIRIGRERVRVILHEHGIGFQRTRTWKTSTDPAYDAKFDRIDEVMSRFRRPGLRVRPVRAVEYSALPRHLLGPPASIRTGRPRPTTARTESGTSTAVTAWPRTGRGARGTNTSAIRAWAAAHKVELCLTPTNASWANPIEAQFGPLRMFTMANSGYPNHTTLARDLHAYLRWRNANNRHPDVLAAQRRERARVRSDRHQRWGRRPETQAA